MIDKNKVQCYNCKLDYDITNTSEMEGYGYLCNNCENHTPVFLVKTKQGVISIDALKIIKKLNKTIDRELDEDFYAHMKDGYTIVTCNVVPIFSHKNYESINGEFYEQSPPIDESEEGLIRHITSSCAFSVMSISDDFYSIAENKKLRELVGIEPSGINFCFGTKKGLMLIDATKVTEKLNSYLDICFSEFVASREYRRTIIKYQNITVFSHEDSKPLVKPFCDIDVPFSESEEEFIDFILFSCAFTITKTALEFSDIAEIKGIKELA